MPKFNFILDLSHWRRLMSTMYMNKYLPISQIPGNPIQRRAKPCACQYNILTINLNYLQGEYMGPDFFQ